MKSILLSLLVLCSILPSFGQNSKPPALTSATPPSPAAASLGKFADIPVGLYTGTPQVSLPLWEVKENGLSLPISLSYHAGGIKVEEIASWVGLGWALNAGGVITRTVRGLPDDANNGYFSKTHPVKTTYDPASQQDREWFKQYADGTQDGEPDLFFFNFAGKSGKFVMDADKNVHILPHQRIKFEPHIPSDSTTEIRRWAVTTEDGTKYTFKALERSKVTSLCGFLYAWPSSAVSSWYLSEIKAPGGARIAFEYTTYSYYDQAVSVSETYYLLESGSGSSEYVKCESRMTVEEGKRLSKIKFDGGQIEFVEGAKRADLVHEPMLEEILVKNQQGNILKKIALSHGYLGGTNIGDISQYPVSSTSTSNLSVRLMLTEVAEVGYESSVPVKKPPYKFTYRTSANGIGLPSRLSYGYQDHWGFFNGKPSSTLVPREMHFSDAVGKQVFLPGADRSVDSASTKVGTLRKIVYPTGGHTVFEFDQNDCQSTMLHKNTDSDYERLDNTTSAQIKKTDPFEVKGTSSSNGAYVDISYQNFTSSKGTFKIFKLMEDGSRIADPVYTSLGQSDFSITHTVFFSKGKYEIELTKSSTDDPYKDPYEMRADWINEFDDPNKWVGGLRVRKVTDYDPVTQKSTLRWYEYKNSSGLSSGRVIGVPEYGYTHERTNLNDGQQGLYYVRTSNSNTPLGTTQGSNVGYEQVTVLYGEGGTNGKSVSIYTSPRLYPDLYAGKEVHAYVENNSNNFRLAFPFAPADSRDWLRGLPLKVTEYRNQDGQFYPVTRIENIYNFYEDIRVDSHSDVLGVKVGYKARYETQGGTYTLAVEFFRVRSGYHNLASTRVTAFDQDTTKKATGLTTYTYSPNHLQLLTSTESTSESDRLITTSLVYPPDYADQSGFIKEMADANILTPIENVVYEEDASKTNQRILSGQISTYKQGGRGLVDELWVLESPSSVPLSGFKFSNAGKSLLPGSGTKTTFGKDPLYKRRIVYSNYDAKGNITQQAKVDDISLSYVWGYGHTLPVAEIKNASYAEVEAALGGAAAVEALSGSSTLSQAQLDQLNGLRTKLTKAFVTIYTYNPLVGMTSSTDPNGRTTYYEYDTFGRLQAVKDEEGNILKSHEYHYAGQQP